MYQTSDDYKSKIYLPSTRHLLKIFINNVEIDKKYILGFKPSHRLFNNDEFTFGSVASKALDLKLYKTVVPDSIESIYVVSGIEGEEVPIGYFNVEERTSKDDYTTTLKLLDNMIKFEVNYDGSTLEYPCNLMTVLTDICNKVGVELGSTSFLNQDAEVAVHDNTVSARTYVSYIAEQAGGFAFIGRDGKLYIKTIGEDIAELPIQYFQDFKWGEQFKVSRVYYENGKLLFPAGDETNNTIYISQENMYIVNQKQIDNIYDKYKNFNCYSFEGSSIIDPALDIGDLLLIDGKYAIYQGDMDYVGKFKANISSKIQAKTKEETMVRTPSQKTINRRMDSRINQVEGSITQVISEVDEQNQKVSKVTQTVDELNSKIQDIADITTFGESMYAKVELDSINESEPIQITVKPTVENISYLYPHENLFPSDDLFLKDRKIRFTNKSLEETDSNKYIDYILPDDLLIAPDGTYDEFYLGYDEQVCQVTKRCQYNADGTVSKLEKEEITAYDYPKIELKDGDYTVELLGYANAYLSLRLMAQNIYTTQFATKAEVKSEISQKADEVNISVDKKLSNYSTTTQMNAAINVKANEITSNVSTTYATKGELNTAKSEIKQTTDSISSTVSKKVGNDEIISKINQSAESVSIQANKININGTISANGNFKVDTNGNMVCRNGQFNGGNIKLLKAGDGHAVFGIYTDNTNNPQYRMLLFDESLELYNYNKKMFFVGVGKDVYGNVKGGILQLNDENGNMKIYCNGNSGNINCVSLTQTSKEENKKNFEKYTESALDRIKNIDIYKYNLKSEEDTDKKHIGFVIGKDYKYSKEVTSTDNQGVDNYSFTSLCCKAIQEQQELIEQLQNEIKELKGEK